MTQPNLLELAKQGDVNAIATLMNRKLQPKGIIAKAGMKNDCLQIVLSAAEVPPQQTLVALIHKSMTSLGAEAIKRVKVYGKQTGEEIPAWDEEFEVVAQTVPNFEELAKQGDVNAIATLISQWLNSQSITAKVSQKDSCLQVMLISAQVPEQQAVVPPIRDGLMSLGIQSVKKVKIYGRETGDDFPDWQQEFELEEQINLSSLTPEAATKVEDSTSIIKTEADNQSSIEKRLNKPSLWGSITKIATNAGGAIAGATMQAGKAAMGKTPEIGGAIAGATMQAGKAAMGKASEVGGAIAGTATQAGKAVVKTATYYVVAPIVDTTGKTIERAKKVSTDWLIRFIDKVDIVKAEAEVRQLEQQYPDEKPSQIAHHLMLNKALVAAGSGLASNWLPGAALAMAGVDLAATTALSAELVYQIAAAYGQDLQSSDRKGEVLTIFGLSLGGNLAIDAGLGLLRKVPIAGAVINASASAAMIYALGYGACRFYEAKNEPLTMEAILEASLVESENYLEGAIVQEAVMDQILVHVILAGNPEKTWSEILPELQTLNLSPASMDAIAANINSPPALETLLEQINSDFAVPLLAQCEKLAQLDGVITLEEAKVIETITKNFGIEINSLVK